MVRFTRLSEDGRKYVADAGSMTIADGNCTGELIERLAKFENMHEHIMKEHEELPKELQALRDAEKTKTYKYRDVFTRKLMNDSFVVELMGFGLK
ncbi:hypothetical protein [Youngiibacter fragilis]|uniref:Uncharacterized protein n=1 Tax=Youngiibacter fragilis 232.1 TaxID=994573 RepID=V7HYA0_9CLOT|nr:hypothetical protein [Youngiibacter fragilis]ETA78955.1 hypothetical protein T472_0219550 [Youngiibacter fragilis 232.1]